MPRTLKLSVADTEEIVLDDILTLGNSAIEAGFDRRCRVESESRYDADYRTSRIVSIAVVEPDVPAFDPAKPLGDDFLPEPDDDLMALAKAVGVTREAA